MDFPYSEDILIALDELDNLQEKQKKDGIKKVFLIYHLILFGSMFLILLQNVSYLSIIYYFNDFLLNL